MIARPIRRTGPIPFAPFPPLAERTLVASPRDTRMRTRWLPPATPLAPSLEPAPPASLHGARTDPLARPAGSPASPPASTSSMQRRTPARSIDPSASHAPRTACHAVYHGQGTLSVLSSITGHHYRFEGRGCTLTIDPRDRLVLGRLHELSIHSASS